jgi:hypothetical protein
MISFAPWALHSPKGGSCYQPQLLFLKLLYAVGLLRGVFSIAGPMFVWPRGVLVQPEMESWRSALAILNHIRRG